MHKDKANETKTAPGVGGGEGVKDVRALVEFKNANETIKTLERIEELIKELKTLISWNLQNEITITLDGEVESQNDKCATSGN